MRLRFVVFAAAGALAVLAGAQAQPAVSASSARNNVPRLLLPVTVLDSKGEPIRGLVADDFRVQDGEHTVLVESVAAGQPPGSEPSSAKPSSAEGSISAVPRKIALVFDVSGELENAKHAAEGFVRQRMEPGDSAAIVTVGDGRHATIPERFLEDREELAAQIRSVPSGSGHANGGGSPETRAASLADSLEELARALAAVPGPKQVVLFSPGEPSAGSSRLAFRRAQCEVDTIVVGRVAPAGSPPSKSPDDDALGKAGVETLGALSRSTGGLLLRSGNGLEEKLGRLLRAADVVYVIAFAPVATGHPGRLHSIRVRVNRRGTRVVCRRAYLETGA